MPQNWKTYKLGELMEIGSSKRIFLSEYVKSGIPFYRSKEVIQRHNCQDISTELFITEEKFNGIKEKFGVPQTEDILLTSVGTLGVPYLIPDSQEPFYFKDGNLTWFKNYERELIHPKFLYFVFDSNVGQNKFDEILIGSTQKGIDYFIVEKD